MLCLFSILVFSSCVAFRTLVQLDTNGYYGGERGFLGQICLGKDWLFSAMGFFSVFTMKCIL